MPNLGLGYTLSDEFTLGYSSTYIQSTDSYWWHHRLVALDGEVNTSPPDSRSLDRRIENLFFGGGHYRWNEKLNLISQLKIQWDVKKEINNEETGSNLSDNTFNLDPELLLRYQLQKRIKLLAGIQYHYLAAHQERRTSSLGSSNSKYSGIGFLVPKFSISKYKKKWKVSLYYVHGTQKKQAFIRKSSDGSKIDGERVEYIPTEYGMASKFVAFNNLWELEAAAVQAGNFGDESSENIHVNEDYLRLKFSGYYQAYGQNLKTTFLHRTLSYSRNAFITLDNIPSTSLAFDYYTGKDRMSYIGIDFGYGKDGQSLPEFNGRYKYQSIGLRLGMRFSDAKHKRVPDNKRNSKEKKKEEGGNDEK